jgi:D-sedoheptulose 7-phosphate isomerase
MDIRIERITRGYRSREETVGIFFEANAARVASLCHLVARRFARGGRLIAFGAGPATTDAQHVSVEFVHPVIVGKRALPAIALANDVPTALGLTFRDPSLSIVRQLRVIGRPEDVALGMVHSSEDPGTDAVGNALKEAATIGMLPLAFGGATAVPDAGEHTFSVATGDPFIVQEVHETLYHVLWELVHVFFEHKGLLEDRSERKSHDTGGASFLYPFLSESESGLDGVLAEVERSIRQKAEEVIAMRTDSCDPEGFIQTAQLIAERISDGGKILAFGNGGSATDAQDLVTDLVAPPEGMASIPAISLTNDAAVITAVGNDVGFDNVFVRQLIAYGAPGDVAVAISTSGGSHNVLAAVEEARRQGLLTVCFAGYGGGRLAELCDRAHTINADYIPRIQEAQASQYHTIRSLLGTDSSNGS